nr:MucR family transcriptional regulator [Methylobacterium nodulans]
MAYVSNNSLRPAELPDLIASVHAAIGRGRAPEPAEPQTPRATPAQIRRSISHEALISFEDSKPYKSLRRHLTTRGLTPEQYRAKWGLPPDYPMVAAAYSEERSALARAAGLGRKRAAVRPPAR